MLSISGATAFLGDDSNGALDIALEDRDYTLLDHDILLTKEDALCSAEGGQTAATKVASDPTIIGVVGTNCSSAMTAAMDTLTGAGLSIISPSNTAPALTLEDGTWKEGYFRACHTDLFQGKVAAEFAYNELGARSLATIHDGSPYADALQEVMAAVFTQLGGEVTFQGAVNVGDTDMRAVLTSAAADETGCAVLPDLPAGRGLHCPAGERDLRLGEHNSGRCRWHSCRRLCSQAQATMQPECICPARMSQALVMMTSLTSGMLSSAAVPQPGFHAFAYDGINIMLDAIEAVAVVDDDGTLHIGRGALREAMAATDDFQGLTGRMNCGTKQFAAGTSHGDCATGDALAIFQLTEAEVAGNWPAPVVYTPE